MNDEPNIVSHIKLTDGKTVIVRGTVDDTTGRLSYGALVYLRDVNDKPVTISPSQVVHITETLWEK